MIRLRREKPEKPKRLWVYVEGTGIATVRENGRSYDDLARLIREAHPLSWIVVHQRGYPEAEMIVRVSAITAYWTEP